MPFFLIIGLWLLPIVSLARFVNQAGPDRKECLKECLEKDTQCEQVPPTCHENILYDLAEAECTHACMERCRSTRVLADGFELRPNEVYEPTCYECCCHRHHHSSNGNAPKVTATPVAAGPAPSKPPATAQMSLLTPSYATLSPLPAPRPAPSPSPPSTPLLPRLSPQPQRHHAPSMTPPNRPNQMQELAACQTGLLSPEELPEAPQSPAVASTSAFDAASAGTSASSFETDTTKIAQLLKAASPSSKLSRKGLASSAPSSRRPSFVNPPPRRRPAAATTATAIIAGISSANHNNILRSNNSGLGGLRGNLSASHSVSSEPLISDAGLVGRDLGRPSYMRGTAASRAKFTSMGQGAGAREPSRLGCSTQLSSSSSGSINVNLNRLSLTTSSFRLPSRH